LVPEVPGNVLVLLAPALVVLVAWVLLAEELAVLLLLLAPQPVSNTVAMAAVVSVFSM
jgi:hypothetical protein